jgi:AraC-like DNA-binding protein
MRHDSDIAWPNRPELDEPRVLERTISGAFMQFMFDRLGSPRWFFAETDLPYGPVPARISVADYIAIVGNIVRNGPDPAYHLTLMDAGIPVHTPGLDLGVRYSPNLRSALELLVRHEPLRRKFDLLELSECENRTTVEFIELVDLAGARPPLVETPLLKIARTIGTYAFGEMHELKVTVRHSAPAYRDRLVNAFQCDVAFGAERNTVSFPAAWIDRANIVADLALWQLAKARCRVEDDEARYGETSKAIRGHITNSILTRGTAPKLSEAAFANQISSRTLTRRLKAEGSQYRDLVDQALKQLALQMIADRNSSISEIADCLGFADPSSFHRSFRRWFGESPSQFRSESEPAGSPTAREEHRAP